VTCDFSGLQAGGTVARAASEFPDPTWGHSERPLP
jgi:hypothetical protein